MTEGGHPRDVWVEVTSFGEATPQFLLAIDGREVEIAEARELYALGRITLGDFEAVLDRVLTEDQL